MRRYASSVRPASTPLTGQLPVGGRSRCSSLESFIGSYRTVNWIRYVSFCPRELGGVEGHKHQTRPARSRSTHIAANRIVRVDQNCPLRGRCRVGAWACTEVG